MQRIRKALDESNHYKDTAARKLHYHCSEEKRTLEFLNEIQAIIEKTRASESVL